MTVMRNAVADEAKFTVEFNPMMYSILSKLVYTDPILACVRELTNNAMDAHVEAGIDKPISVTLPNALEPVFICRDYGNGLSHEDVMGLYSTYGMSTKRNRSDVVGQFGVGSKSPLAYTEQFVVSSYHNGVKRTYTAFKGEDGTPSIALLHEEPCDSTGLEVKVSAKQGDYEKFRIAAERVFELFVPHPIITGNSNYTKRTVNYVGDFGTAKLRDSRIDYNTATRVVVGRIAYPLKSEHFEGKYRTVFEANFDIYVPVRDVTVSASREELFYDDRTKAAVSACVQDILDNVMLEFYNNLHANANTWLEAVKFWYENTQSYHAPYRWALNRNTLHWNGRELVTGENVPNFFEIAKDLTQDRARYDATRFVEFYNCRNPAIIISNHRNVRARVKYNFANYGGRVYIASRAHWRELYNALGGAKVYRASALADKPRKPAQRNPTAVQSVPVGKFNPQFRSYNGRQTLIDATVDISKGGFYVVLDNYKMHCPVRDSRLDHMDTDRFLTRAHTAGFCDKTEVLFVSKSVAKKFDKAGNWHELNQYVADALKSGFTRNELRSLALSIAANSYTLDYDTKKSYSRLREALETDNAAPHIRLFSKGIYKYTNKNNILEAKVGLYNWFYDSKDLYINPLNYDCYQKFKTKFSNAYAKFNKEHDFLLRILRACNSNEEALSVTRAYFNNHLS